MLPTVFDRYGADRLTVWKEFRDSLEVSVTPFEDVANLWSHAPFVSSYLNPQKPAEWPDAWHLVLDDRLDQLAIALGIVYTIKLTRRFIDTKCEIHTSMFPKEKEPRYVVVVDDKHVLNLEYSSVAELNSLEQAKTSLLWTKI